MHILYKAAEKSADEAWERNQFVSYLAFGECQLSLEDSRRWFRCSLLDVYGVDL